MAVNKYDRGTEVRLSASYVDLAGAAVDPTTVTFEVKDPLNAITSYTSPDVVRDSTGNYHLDVLLNASGPWWYRTEGTGAFIAAAEKQLTVKPSQF
jgi:hypothetical protein